MNSTEQAVDFLGHQINCVQDADGTPYVALKWLCEILGIDHNRQRREIKERGVFDWKIVSVKGTDGRHRKMLCLPLKQACLWFYVINPNTVRPEIKERLLEYQEESTTALRHQRQYGLTFNPRFPAEQIESRVRESGYRYIQERFPSVCDTVHGRVALLLAELDTFGQFYNEAPPYRDKARECIGAAVDQYFEWMIRHGHDPFFYREIH
jgi:hypothetical protein